MDVADAADHVPFLASSRGRVQWWPGHRAMPFVVKRAAWTLSHPMSHALNTELCIPHATAHWQDSLCARLLA